MAKMLTLSEADWHLWRQTCFLVRDGQMKGSHIHILEAMDIAGGACDGIYDSSRGYVMRGGRDGKSFRVPVGSVPQTFRPSKHRAYLFWMSFTG